MLTFIRHAVMILVGLTLPFEHTRVMFAGIPLTPNKALAAVLLAYVGIEWAAKLARAPRDPKRLWILFFGVATAVSAVPSYVVAQETSGLGFLLLLLATVFMLVLFYLILTYTIRSREDVDLLLTSFVVGCVLVSITGWLGYGAQVEGARYGQRLAGEGANPNLIAFNLIVAIPAAASLMFTTARPWAKPLYFAAIGTMIVACLATLSRSAFVALPLMVAFWAFRFRRVNFLGYAAPVLVLAIVAVAFAPENVVSRFRDVAEARSIEDLDASARDRFLMIPGMARAFASNPVIGVGLGQYRWWALRNGEIVHGIHNAYLQVLVEQGLVSFVPFLVVIGVTWASYSTAFRTARRLRAHQDPELGVLGLRAALLQASLMGALVMALAQPATHHKSLWLLFALSTVLAGLVRERARALEAGVVPSADALARAGYGQWVARPAR